MKLGDISGRGQRRRRKGGNGCKFDQNIHAYEILQHYFFLKKKQAGIFLNVSEF